MKTSLVLLLWFAFFSVVPARFAEAETGPHEIQQVTEAKAEVLALARSFAGQADPDFSKQHQLDNLVNKLLRVAQPVPVKERLPLLYGTWKQVWGPYDYRKHDRSIDPDIGIEEIYQVIFEGGYYYNVSPVYKNGDRSKERIGLLRGEFRQDPKNDALLRIKFTNYPGVKSRPGDGKIWNLAARAEAGTLEDETSIVPSLIVKLFFGSGALREVYTDADLRITYGSDGKDFSRENLYVMTRVK